MSIAPAQVQEEFGVTLDRWMAELTAALHKRFGLVEKAGPPDEPRDDHGRWEGGGSVPENIVDTNEAGTGPRDFTQPGDDNWIAMSAKYEAWVKDQNKNLTPKQEAVLKKYMAHLKSTYFQDLNNYMRTGHVPPGTKEQFKEDAAVLKGLVEKSVLPGNLTVFRGGDSKISKGLKVGSVITDKGFVSTSVRSDTAIGFATEHVKREELLKNPPSVFQINVPKGHAGYFPKEQVWEHELILPPNSRFRVIDVKPKTTVYRSGRPRGFVVNLYTLEAVKR